MQEASSSLLLRAFYRVAIVLGVAVALITASIGTAIVYEYAYKDAFYPGIRVGSVSLSGLSYKDANAKLQDTIDQATRNGFSFKLQDTEILLNRTVEPIHDPDLAHDLLRCDTEKTLQQAYSLGRGRSFLQNSVQRATLFFKPKTIDFPCVGDTAVLKKQLLERTTSYAKPAIDARIKVEATSSTQLTIEPEQKGLSISLDSAIETWQRMTSRMSYQQIPIESAVLLPKITANTLQPLLNDVPTYLKHAPFTLTVERVPFTVNTSTLASWITSTSTKEGMKITLSPEALAESLQPTAKPFLQAPKNGFLELDEQNRIKTFTAPKEGVSIDTVKTIEAIEQSFTTTTKKTPITVSLQRVTPSIEGADAERLGIRDLLGVGKSYFDGSPTNRRKNIAKGKEKMNGILLAPGEEFSQLKALGDIDGAHGWLPELVIKGDKTVPEYGGGLCQIGSTSFRAAMEAGLKITQRRNHSYRVRYYEPIGTDATIYEPSPDFRFLNDTPGHILITTEMKGDGLYFSIWGTDDGREAKQKLSGAYNIIPAPATKYIETTDLAPGQKKCTESAHAGATAHVDYSVSYSDGTSSTQRFTSVYRPWGAVCLIGVEKLTESVPASTETIPLTE